VFIGTPSPPFEEHQIPAFIDHTDGDVRLALRRLGFGAGNHCLDGCEVEVFL
jgi:hypothetical protein